VLLLNGYLFFAKSLEKTSNQTGNRYKNIIKTLKSLAPSKFYQNGVRIAKKYLGSSHFLTKKMISCEKNLLTDK